MENWQHISLHLEWCKASRRRRLELVKMRAELLSTWSGSDLIFFHTFVCSPSNLYDQDASCSNQVPSFFFPGAIKYNKPHGPSQETKLSSLVQSISHSFHVIQQFMVVLRQRTPPPFPSHFKQEITSQKPLGEAKQCNEITCRTSHESYNGFFQKPQCFHLFTSHFIYMLTAFY